MHLVIKKQLALAALVAATAALVSYSLAAAEHVDATPHGTTVKLSRAAENAGQFVDDVAITTTVKARLVADETTKARDIKVETRNGVVQLSGQVDTSRELRKAESIARSVDGVQFVKNELKLKTL